jgi:hypothetical protein
MELGRDDHRNPKLQNVSFFYAAFGGQRHYSLGGIVERRALKGFLIDALETGVSVWRRRGRNVPAYGSLANDP